MGLAVLRTRELFLAVLAEVRGVERLTDPDRAVLARLCFGAGLRAEVRAVETRRVFAITSARPVRRSDSSKSGPNRSRPDETYSSRTRLYTSLGANP